MAQLRKSANFSQQQKDFALDTAIPPRRSLNISSNVKAPMDLALRYGASLNEGAVQNARINASVGRNGVSAGISGRPVNPYNMGFNMQYGNPNFNAGVNGRFDNPGNLGFNLGARANGFNAGINGRISDIKASDLMFGYSPNRDTNYNIRANPARKRIDFGYNKRF